MTITKAPPIEVTGPEGAPPDPKPGESRRSFLRRAGLAGGTLVVVAAGGGTYRAYDNGVFEA